MVSIPHITSESGHFVYIGPLYGFPLLDLSLSGGQMVRGARQSDIHVPAKQLQNPSWVNMLMPIKCLFVTRK